MGQPGFVRPFFLPRVTSSGTNIVVVDRMLESADDEVIEHCLGILRNVTCTTHREEPITGLLGTEMGEARMLSILEDCLETRRSDLIVKQASGPPLRRGSE